MRLALAGLLTALVSATADAQLGELQPGLLASMGTGETWGPGAGLVLGIAPGRLTYLGVRWQYHFGPTTDYPELVGAPRVRTRLQVFAVDVGVMIPAGPVDLLPGVTIGALRFSQRTLDPGLPGGETTTIATEFYAAPTAAVEVHLGLVALIPELQVNFAGDPELRFPVQYRGLLLGLRLVVPIEIERFRY